MMEKKEPILIAILIAASFTLAACKHQDDAIGPAQKVGRQIDQKIAVAKGELGQKLNQAQIKINKAMNDAKQKIQNDPDARAKIQKAMDEADAKLDKETAPASSD
jgi:uncharacterized protein YpuA (DUF1002 family)